MKIVSTTLAGPGSEATIGQAIRSVAPLVDAILVIETTPEMQGAQAISDAVQAGLADLDRTVEVCFGSWTWQNDFARARNRALAAATQTGADWCLWIDTDEWFVCEDPAAVRMQLSATRHGALMMQHRSRTYCQPRAIRLPTAERWVGKTHECFAAYKVGQGDLDDIVFDEHPKTPEQLKYKFERDRDILLAEVEREPGNARSWFYLGESLKNLGTPKTALAAYEQCASLRGWNEESGWACYRAAECQIATDDLLGAIDSCARGLALHAGMPELAWLAGWCNHKLGRHEQAIHWSTMAIANGHFRASDFAVRLFDGSPRIGFRHPPALFEGPYDVLTHSYRALGWPSVAARAERDCAAAITERDRQH